MWKPFSRRSDRRLRETLPAKVGNRRCPDIWILPFLCFLPRSWTRQVPSPWRRPQYHPPLLSREQHAPARRVVSRVELGQRDSRQYTTEITVAPLFASSGNACQETCMFFRCMALPLLTRTRWLGWSRDCLLGCIL